MRLRMSGGSGWKISAAKNFYVYAWLRPCGDPFYIGKGRGSRATTIVGRSNLFNKIVAKIRRAGGEPSVVRLYENLAEHEAFEKERLEIARFGRIDNGSGILANLTDGGEGMSGHTQSPLTIAMRVGKTTGMRRTPETRAKMSAWQVGRVMSDEAKANMSASRTGKRLSPEHRAKLSAAGVGRTASPETRRKIALTSAGRSVSDDTRRRQSAARKGRPLTPEHILAREASKRLSGPQPNSKSGFKGVSFSKSMNKWSAEISISRSRSKIGYFVDIEDAARAYDAAAISAFGAGNCYLNFPAAANDN